MAIPVTAIAFSFDLSNFELCSAELLLFSLISNSLPFHFPRPVPFELVDACSACSSLSSCLVLCSCTSYELRNSSIERVQYLCLIKPLHLHHHVFVSAVEVEIGCISPYVPLSPGKGTSYTASLTGRRDNIDIWQFTDTVLILHYTLPRIK